MFENLVGFLPEALVLDVPELDDQHESLFALVASLKTGCIEVNRFLPGPADKLLQELRAHFATEERLAKDASMYFSDHAWKHEEMLSALTRAFGEAREGRREVFSLLRYIDYWFERHISEEDRRLSSCLLCRPLEGLDWIRPNHPARQIA